jgi:tRNA dimethylallyltransferase
VLKQETSRALPLLIIAGPTGVGKTRVAIELAERLNGEIVGADSRQIYRYLDIGTAKPSPEERARVPHHLIDICNPEQNYSAADYARDAAAMIEAIAARGKIPLLVGGTGLYIHSVLYGIFEGPGRDDDFRAHMQSIAETQGEDALFQELVRRDPLTAHRLHPHDRVRVIRALEVHHLTGRSISEFQTTATAPCAHYHVCFLVLTAPRPLLYARIEARVDHMLAQGLIEEVRGLLQRGYHQGMNALNSVGYAEILDFLAGRLAHDAAISLIKRNTRRYAKRQLTWFRKYPQAIWVRADDSDAPGGTLSRCWQQVLSWQASQHQSI